MVRRIVQVLLPVLIIGGGAAGAGYMVKKRPKAARQKAKKPAMVVDIVELAPVDHRVTVSGQGTVIPERTVVIQPQVSGTIVEEAAALQNGGRVRKGDVLARIDDRDYKLQIQLREADVKRAQFEITVERGRRSVAKREWKLLAGSVASTVDGKKLALRQPHKAQAEANLAAAQSAVAAAKLNLGRTVIRAPFDAIVRDKRAALGQLVGPGTPIATLVQADRFLVQVSVPLSDLSWIRVPGLNAKADEGSLVTISYEAGSAKRALRTGRVVRLLGDLDAAGRLARIMVAVNDPLDVGPVSGGEDGGGAGVQTGEAGSANAKAAELPLLLGSYVRADIRGKALSGVYRIPAEAVREGDKIWLADTKDLLKVRQLNIVWRERNSVLVRGGIEVGERMIISRVPSAVAGMKVKPRNVGGAATRRVKADKPLKPQKPQKPRKTERVEKPETNAKPEETEKPRKSADSARANGAKS